MHYNTVKSAFDATSVAFRSNPFYFLKENDFVCFLKQALESLYPNPIDVKMPNNVCCSDRILKSTFLQTTRVHTQTNICGKFLDLSIFAESPVSVVPKANGAIGHFFPNIDVGIEVKVVHNRSYPLRKLRDDIDKLNELEGIKSKYLFIADFQNADTKRFSKLVCNLQNPVRVYYCTTNIPGFFLSEPL